jgi:nicotinamide-nucleotide amidase
MSEDDRRGFGARLEIVAIGEELLGGETVDTNAAWLGRTLKGAGLRVVRRATVGDDVAAIRAAVREALTRVSVVLCTGGLGPTRDDVTLDAVAGLAGVRLEESETLVRELQRRFAARGLTMPEINRRQARVPAGATVFPNPRGTAPGLAIAVGDGQVLLLPGVPQEMRAITEASVLPFLQRQWPASVRPETRVLRTTGIAESSLAERVEDVVATLTDLEVAFLPGYEGVDVRLTSWGGATDALDAAVAALASRLERWLYTVGLESLEEVVAAELVRRGRRLVVAESCTGGLLAKRLTDLPGSSRYLLAGWVAYVNRAKELFLAVPPSLLADHGAVSEQAVRAMAEGGLRFPDADYAVAITGVAGPSGGTVEKPVGTVWIAVAGAGQTVARRLLLPGDRAEIRDRSAQAALHLLLRQLRREGRGHDHAQ